jgi:hypothetical protein
MVAGRVVVSFDACLSVWGLYFIQDNFWKMFITVRTQSLFNLIPIEIESVVGKYVQFCTHFVPITIPFNHRFSAL